MTIKTKLLENSYKEILTSNYQNGIKKNKYILHQI